MSKNGSAEKVSKPKKGRKKETAVMKDFVVSQAFVVNEHLIDGPDDIFDDDQN